MFLVREYKAVHFPRIHTGLAVLQSRLSVSWNPLGFCIYLCLCLSLYGME